MGGRERYCKPSLTKTLWRKDNRTVVSWAFLCGDGKAPPFDSVKAMSTATGGLINEAEGAQQIAGGHPADSGNRQHRCPQLLPEERFWIQGKDCAGIPEP